MSEKYVFQDFSASVGEENQPFVRELHEELTQLGCKTDEAVLRQGAAVIHKDSANFFKI